MGGDTVQDRFRALSQKLGGSPFFPLLFIGEGVKNVVYHLVATSPSLDVVGTSLTMAVCSVVAWLYLYDDVSWGLSKAADVIDSQE